MGKIVQTAGVEQKEANEKESITTRVAKQLFMQRMNRSLGRDLTMYWDTHAFAAKWAECGQEQYLANARSVISAMREPTEDMLKSAEDVHWQGNLATWRAMIDAALLETAT